MKKLLLILFVLVACETESIRVEYPANGRYGINILADGTDFINDAYSMRVEPFGNLVETRIHNGHNIFFDQHTGWDMTVEEGSIIMTTSIPSDFRVVLSGCDSTLVEYYENDRFVRSKTIYWE